MRKRIREIHFKTCGLTDEGLSYRRRGKENQDSFIIHNDLGLLAIADGVGGYQGGKIASQIAVSALKEVCELYFSLKGKEHTFTEDEPRFSSVEEGLKEAFRSANREIFRKNSGKKTAGEGMGTTLVCIKIHNGKVHVVNSGDSRCYLIRTTIEKVEEKEQPIHRILRLTEDHSKVEEIVQAGRAEENDEKLNPWRRYVKGALGFSEDIDPDVVSSLPQRGDLYLLCSDGLSKMLNDEKIKDVVVKAEKNIEKACKDLIKEANNMGGKDNITALMLEVTSVDSSIFDSLKLGEMEQEEHENTFQSF